jgi:hypothetical protein
MVGHDLRLESVILDPPANGRHVLTPQRRGRIAERAIGKPMKEVGHQLTIWR